MATEKGIKLDAGKPLLNKGLFSQFPAALEAVARVSQFGAEKYTWGGWKTVPDGKSRYTEALLRHLMAEQKELNDRESGLAHLAHAAWNALAILELSLYLDEDTQERAENRSIPTARM